MSDKSETTKEHLTKVFRKWDDPAYTEELGVIYDWKSAVIPHLREGNVEAMKTAGAPTVQWGLLKLAHEASSESTRLQALTFLASQAGHGPVQKIDHTVNYEKMPADQLMANIASKFQRLAEKVPGLTLDAVLTQFQNRLSEPVSVEAQEASQEELESDA